MEQKNEVKNCVTSIRKNIYARRENFKNQVETEALELEQKVSLADPEYARLSLKYKSNIIDNAKCMARSNFGGEIKSQANGMLNESLQNLEKYKKNKGYDFTPKYKCKICNDTLKINDLPCICIQTEIKAAIVEACGIRSANRRTFDEVDFSVVPGEQQRKELKGVYSVLGDYAEKFKAKYIGYEPKNVLLCGSAGLGKTFLLECICSDAIKRGLLALYFKAFELTEYFLKIYLSDNQDKTALWDMLYGADLLFIDDLGTEPIYKNISEPYLYQLIDYRYTYKKPFFISTNFDPTLLMAKYAERIASRILDTNRTIAYGFFGKDMRIEGLRK